MKTFKKINIFFALFFGACSFSSCDYLDKEPDTELNMDMVYSNKTYVEDALAYVYSGLPNPSEGWMNEIGWGSSISSISLIVIVNNLSVQPAKKQ